MGNKKENNFLVHGGILALASVAVRFIGMIYRIPMVNIIGRVGNGYYSTAYSVYNILLLLSSYSMPLAVSKMVSARVSVGKWRETKRVVEVALAFAVIVGLIFGLGTWLLADFFCAKIMKSPLAAIALRWMAPTVFIMAVLGVLRGFFQGMQTTIPTAISQLLEQIVNALVSVGMAFLLVQHGKELQAVNQTEGLASAWGAAGGTIGTGAGALTALIFCGILFLSYRKTYGYRAERDTHRNTDSYGKLFGILIATAVPVIISTAAYNSIDIIDVAIFNNASERMGLDGNTYTAIWGDYNSAYLLLVHLPVALASAVASALVPSLTAARIRKDMKGLRRKMNLTVKVTLIVSIPCAFALMAIGGNVAKLLFTDVAEESRLYLVVGGIAVVFQSLSTVTNAILQSLDHMERPVIHAVISLFIHIIVLLLLLFVFKLGIYAVIISYTLFMLSMCVLNLFSIYNLIGYRLEPIRSIAVPAIASLVMALMCLFVSLVFRKLLTGRMMQFAIVSVSAVLGVPIYGILVLLSGCLSRSQILELPGGRTLASFSDKLRGLLGRGGRG